MRTHADTIKPYLSHLHLPLDIANLRFNILNKAVHWSLPITAHGSGGKESEYMALVPQPEMA